MILPKRVAINKAYLERLGVWHLVSRNLPATSCADAAQKRDRLGSVGIPLWDELKSHVGAYEHESHGRRFVVAHCRGHQLRDDNKLNAFVGAMVEKVTADELRSVFGLEYGLINPFAFVQHPLVTQVFDESVLGRYFPPHTMMTNLGDAEYGVEFDPRELVSAMQAAHVGRIVADDHQRAPVEHSLGILTGNSPESGIALWQRINHKIRTEPRLRFRGDTGFPRVVVQSIPEMGLSMELQVREAEVRETVLTGVDRLCSGGATVIGIACNTTQYFTPEVRRVCADHGAQFISLVDETAAVLKGANVRTFDLLGIGAVSDLQRWSDFRRITPMFDIEIPSDRNISRITELAFEVKERKVSSRAVTSLRNVINQCTVTDTVLLALTELSIVMETQKKQRSAKRFVDTLSVLADRMADAYLEERIRLMSADGTSAVKEGGEKEGGDQELAG